MGSSNEYNSRARSVFVVTTITFVLASVFVAARLVSRFVVLKSRTADDYVIILAWCIAFGLSVSIDYGCSRGLGRRDKDIPARWQAGLRESEYAFTILYNPALMATKTSILIFYLRMSKNTQKLLRIVSYITLGLVNVAGVVLTFLNAFQCKPVSAAYSPLVSDDSCWSIVTLYLCSAPINIITDLAILVLPIPVLTGMRLPQRQKTILILTFTLGIFVTVVDIIRIYFLQKAIDDWDTFDKAKLGMETDFAWNASTAFMWSAVEVNVGMICACIPTLKPLIKHVWPKILASSRDGTTTEKEASFASHASHVSMDPVDITSPRPLTSDEDPSELAPVHTNDAVNQVDMMDFLTVPTEIGAGTFQGATHINNTHVTDNTVYFGFVNMSRPKSMLEMKGVEAFKYCAVVTILFFLWGFSYGLLNILNSSIAIIAQQTQAQSLGLTTAYFGAYLFGSLTVGQWTLRHVGFKATFITGLCIYGVGTLMFWPCAVLLSYPGFIISQFVVAFGLSILETAANPFIALCGPSRYAEYRLLLCQAVQASATVLSQALAQKVLFVKVSGMESLVKVQWTYLAIALFTVILALFFYYMPLPEASSEDLQAQAERIHVDQPVLLSLPHLPLIYVSLGIAFFAQFTYVAGQESVSTFFTPLLTSIHEAHPTTPLTLSSNNYGLLSHSLFALSRFIFAPLTLCVLPRHLLLAAFLLTLLFAILTQALPSPNTNHVAAPALLVLFFEGPIYPLIYALGLRGMGRRTKWAAAALTAACVGGAIFPFVLWAVQRVDGRSVQFSFCVLVALLVGGGVYPVFLNVVPRARWVVDSRGGEVVLGGGREGDG